MRSTKPKYAGCSRWMRVISASWCTGPRSNFATPIAAGTARLRSIEPERDNGLGFGGPAFAHGSHFLGGLELHGHAVRIEFQRDGQLAANSVAVVLERSEERRVGKEC